MLKLEKQKGGAGVVWVVIVVIVILLLAWWFFGSSSDEPAVSDNMAQEQIQDPEAASIAADLQGLDTVDLEAEFQDIESDLNQL